MAREISTKQQLTAWITAEIRKTEGCAECIAGGIIALQEPDETGCNWSDQITLTVTGIPPEIYETAAQSAIMQARSKFNIK